MLTQEQNEMITRVGPGTPGGEFWRRFWLPTMVSGELPEPDCPPVRLRLLGENLIAFRTTSGRVGLVADNCPHRGASLFFGRNEEEGLRCVYHGWKFDTEGRCVDMPNEPPESNFKHKVQVPAYPCQEKAGVIWTYMGPKELTPEMPQMGWMLVPESHCYITKIWVESNWLQALEGDIDNSHAAFNHGLIGGTADMPFLERLRLGRVAAPQVMPRGTGTNLFMQDLAPRGMVVETDYGIMMGWQRYAGEESYQWHINHWMMPSYAQISANLCNVRFPMDDHNSWWLRVSWNAEQPLTEEQVRTIRDGGVMHPELIPGTFRPKEHKDNDYLIDRQWQKTGSVTGIKSIPQQDRAVTESMGAIYDRRQERLGTSDTVIIQMRRRLLREMRALAEGKEPYPSQHGEIYRVRGCDVILNRSMNWQEGAKELMTIPVV